MTLYNPEHFQAQKSWPAVVHQHPLATVITGAQISHLPLIFDEQKNVLIGHLARANPHSRALDNQECTAIFHGPQAYVSPLWYAEYDVPTWNYVVVHVKGVARVLADPEPALRKLSDRMEGPDGWQFGIPADLTDSLQKAILAFEIRVESVEAKFKLSQNRSAVDREGVMRGLAATAGENNQSQALLRYMEKT